MSLWLSYICSSRTKATIFLLHGMILKSLVTSKVHWFPAQSLAMDWRTLCPYLAIRLKLYPRCCRTVWCESWHCQWRCLRFFHRLVEQWYWQVLIVKLAAFQLWIHLSFIALRWSTVVPCCIAVHTHTYLPRCRLVAIPQSLHWHVQLFIYNNILQ